MASACAMRSRQGGRKTEYRRQNAEWGPGIPGPYHFGGALVVQAGDRDIEWHAELARIDSGCMLPVANGQDE